MFIVTVPSAFAYQRIAHARKFGIKTITMNWSIATGGFPERDMDDGPLRRAPAAHSSEQRSGCI
ncbi:hypothetical protein DPMN_187997 [Dreissena polymorpha]|uniref:Uncharacterized protein n=1 Tax=Dreissena polymorpha TaxID=45954 RepID=A0A9D4DR94_DREPO|nr:hypothetical protein DPMN_187997 [Dreissena polymorpha]